MKWVHKTWEVKRLLTLYDSGKINLSPEYQRNPIWTSKSQRLLIDTILAPQPMPNFFLLQSSADEYEMVDGQQRTRSIIDFRNGYITSSSGVKYDKLAGSTFMNYKLNITLVTSLDDDESIEEFYALVNMAGLRLNVPELRKARYYDTTFLSLCSEMAALDKFVSLDLFSSATVLRMNDVELVSELLALLSQGYSEKKEAVDRIFEADVTGEQADELRNNFGTVVDVLTDFDSISPLKKTRFRQRADLYTLFDFIWSNRKITSKGFESCYKIMLAIAPHIRPTQEHCDPLRDYARNCVSQSNSKRARMERSDFFNALMRNPNHAPNDTQKAVADFLKLGSDLCEIEGAWAIDIAPIEEGQ
jgi:hypothetical protein